MNRFVLFTDLACDIDPEYLKQWDVQYCSLTFHFEDEPELEYKNDEYSIEKFYAEVRSGRVARTAAVDKETLRSCFTRILDAGSDLLYLAFSSGLSSTYSNAMTVAEEIRPLYPERKLLISDTRSASAGMGLLVYLTAQKRDSGASLEETFEFAETMRFKLCHWFTVDDLKYMRRGGRVSAAAAFFGGVLSIKPVMHMDDPGHLIPVQKVSGRRNSIVRMADKYGELAVDKEHGTVFISHGDCIKDAEMLAGMLHDRYGVEVKIITMVGMVIGAHSGPGTLALFFVGSER